MKYKIYNQDVVEWAKEYKKGKFHALISDAPYHLTSITKRFGKKNSAPVKVDEFFDGNGKSKGSSPYSRTSKGFMGQTWDGGDVAFRAETWEAICEHLYPGGFGMVFSASRNWHRLAVAIEDAGMIIHPTIFGWLNGQGFPKATNISKQLDKSMGLEPIKGKLRNDGRGKDPLKTSLRGSGDTGIGHADGSHQTYYEELPASEQSSEWVGHRYGLQALKPAVEPIIVFQKPYEGRPLNNIVATGAGAINIDGGRIPVSSPVTINRFTKGAKPWGDAVGEEFETVETLQGRWPANFILDESVAPLLDAQSGDIKGSSKLGSYIVEDAKPAWKQASKNRNVNGFGDSGGASRFFYNVQEQIDEADPIYYCGKVNKTERNAGLDDLPDKIYAQSGGAQAKQNKGETEYLQDSIESNRISIRKNNHPTMKPIALAKYLATLLLPPDSYSPRRILVPFSGVGSEMIGAMQAGWEQIVGIEFDTENGYVDIAHKRIEYWSNKR